MKLDLLSRKQVRSLDRVGPFVHVAAEDLAKVSAGVAVCVIHNLNMTFICGNYSNL